MFKTKRFIAFFFHQEYTIGLPKRSTMSQVLPLAPREIGLRDSTATSQSTEVHSRQPGDTGLRRSPRIRFHARQITCEAFPQIGFATFSESLASPPRRGEMQGRGGGEATQKRNRRKIQAPELWIPCACLFLGHRVYVENRNRRCAICLERIRNLLETNGSDVHAPAFRRIAATPSD